MSESEIENELLELTPPGLKISEVKKIIADKIGKNKYSGDGPADNKNGDWTISGFYTEWSTRPISKPFHITYKLSRYPTIHVIPEYVYASWFFNEEEILETIKVKKEIDGI
tara:strand:+ start:106 stop:438 length:333 start_codon:yes stop_codon:yes gene_type:complete